jgi:drug/metabolite transporter (DMT)-like permease
LVSSGSSGSRPVRAPRAGRHRWVWQWSWPRRCSTDWPPTWQHLCSSGGSVPLMARMLAIGSILTAPFGLIGLTESRIAVGPLLATVALGVAGTGAAFALMASLVGRVGGPRASFITYLIPLVALALGAVFLSETVAIPALIGAALVLAASAFASRPED